MLEKYNSEFEELDIRFSSYTQGIEDSKKKHEDLLERIDVLKEKRQQLYHQAEITLEKLTDSGMQQKDVNTILENMARAKLLSSLDEEKVVVESILSALSSGGGLSDNLVPIKLKMEEAINSHKEVVSATSLENDLTENQKL